MQIADIGGVRMHWREDGSPDGPPLVFANSLGTDLRVWDAIIPLLPASLRIIRFDKRGHGLSSCPPGPYTMDDLIGDTEGLINHLGASNCVFVGLSIGGMIAQGLSAKRPDLISALVLSNTAAKMGTPDMWQARIAAIREGGIAAQADGILERWFTPEFRATPQIAAWHAMLTRTPAEGYLGCCEAIAAADLTERTRALTLPALGIGGSADGSSPPELVSETTGFIPGSRFELITGAGHIPCVEKPAQYAGLISGFLKETGRI